AHGLEPLPVGHVIVMLGYPGGGTGGRRPWWSWDLLEGEVTQDLAGCAVLVPALDGDAVAGQLIVEVGLQLLDVGQIAGDLDDDGVIGCGFGVGHGVLSLWCVFRSRA